MTNNALGRQITQVFASRGKRRQEELFAALESVAAGNEVDVEHVADLAEDLGLTEQAITDLLAVCEARVELDDLLDKLDLAKAERKKFNEPQRKVQEIFDAEDKKLKVWMGGEPCNRFRDVAKELPHCEIAR